jgi:hypothetical protein
VGATRGRLRGAGGALVPSPGERAGEDRKDVVRARRPGEPNAEACRAEASRARQLLPRAPPEPVQAVSRAPTPLHHPETSGDTEAMQRIDGADEGPAEERVA